MALLLKQIYQLLVFLSLNFIAVQSCCPYFDTDHFRAKLGLLNSSAGCIAPFDESGVSFSGSEKSCSRIFAGRAFCKWKCFYECNFESLMGVYCSDVTCGGDGKDPSNIYFTCSCTGQLKNSMGMSCNTMQHNWADVELFHNQFCIAGMTPPIYGQNAFGQGSLTNTDTNSKRLVITVNGGNGGTGGGQSSTINDDAISSDDQKISVNTDTKIESKKFIIVRAPPGPISLAELLNMGGGDSGQVQQQVMDMNKKALDGTQ